ncbi:hypothetical protein Lal_00000347 [Lupinus albus]|uniref:Uncharacterized protein n=1 Tax=Lupinus albus TaxID=3870 RepID=A0A6A4NE62_LUPAL|nr:hypothetical protein Lalb_Chr21g0304901 [Lupinus albus]KAF1860932.1 hypothetical protein Lal_00000347 [Lupinus albus]
MGKDYWNWSGSRSSSKSKRSREVQTAEIPSGCMCAVFQVFDFHPFHFSLNQQQHQQQQQQQTLPKGAEAPRNSLESEDDTISSITKDENLKIPKNIRIRTSGGRGGNLNDFSSEIISSPGTKTPTLVARLMGLDLLPDALHSSSSSSSSCLSTPNEQGHVNHHFRQRQHVQLVKHRNSTGSCNNDGGIRSLHETPRSSDVEHTRLSLQINKENMDLDLPRISFSKRKCNNEDYNYSSSRNHYARQIVKQVKESVSRKVGLDITNTVKIREKEREEFVNQLRLKKSLKKSVDESSPRKHSTQSHSPGLSRFMDTKNNPTTKLSSPLTPKDQNIILKPQSPSPLANVEAQVSRVLTKSRPQTLPEQELQNQKPAPKCKKMGNEKFSSMINKPQQKSSIRRKQEEAFVIRPPPSPRRDIDIKTKRTHSLPCNVLKNLNTTVSTLHPVKTCTSPPASKIPQKQVSETREPKWSTQLSICSSQRYKQEALAHTLGTQGRVTNDKNKSNGVSTTTEEGPEFQYISTILTRTTVPHQWFSSSHPLDPSNFHQHGLYPTYNSTLSSTHDDKDSIFTRNNQLGPRCNQRLLFDLIGQVLSEILVKPKYCNYDDGVSLLETVWNKVRSFPRAKCEVLEDIDGLIEMKDEEEEGREREEGLVEEIEGNIFETLVHETVTVMVGAV